MVKYTPQITGEEMGNVIKYLLTVLMEINPDYLKNITFKGLFYIGKGPNSHIKSFGFDHGNKEALDLFSAESLAKSDENNISNFKIGGNDICFSSNIGPAFDHACLLSLMSLITSEKREVIKQKAEELLSS